MPSKYPLEYIQWIDAVCCQDVWIDSDQLTEFHAEGGNVEQAGFVIEEGDTFIVLASRVLDDGKSYGGVFKIPKAFIVHREVIK